MLHRSQVVVPTLLTVLCGLLGACDKDLESYLEGEPCTVQEDCWHTQECVQTPEEAGLGIPGLCQPEGSTCVFGNQLGCECEPVQAGANCLYNARPSALDIDYPSMICDEMQRRCVVAPEDGM
ncbi:MAG TPA: hypothetical protein ENJ18_12810 [Nannocystis exedens]|nr:hypothetical protein [Nannocystis exedens]